MFGKGTRGTYGAGPGSDPDNFLRRIGKKSRIRDAFRPVPPGMQVTATFRRQHKELMGLAGELLVLLEPGRVRARTPEVVLALARFSGKLKVHAAMENQALYPSLFTDEDEEVQRTARALFAEVGDLYRVFERHARRWCSGEAIAADAEAFVEETAEFVRLLGARMMRENLELYPLVESRAERGR